MSIIFTIFGILSFAMFAYAIYAQNEKIEQLKKLSRYQQKTIARLSTLRHQGTSDVQQNLNESWAEIEKILDQDTTKN